MKVTIVTVTYNAEELLEKTILSVRDQTYLNIEYLIIDGNSTDATVDIIKKYEDTISYWISEPDEGIYYAMNKAIDKASGDYINFMNAGDTFSDLDIVKYVMAHNGKFADLIYGNHRKKQSNILKKAIDIDKWYTTMPFCHQTLFTKTSLMKKNKFDTHYKIAADLNFIYKMYNLKKKFLYINKEIAVFDESGFAKTNDFLMHIESIKILLEYNINYVNIEKSWWFRSLKTMMIEENKSFKNVKNNADFFLAVDNMVKVSLVKNPSKKYSEYKKLISLYDSQRKENNIIKKELKQKVMKKYTHKFTYSVVSAVYNAQKYLNEYFESLIKQTVNFKDSIFLILVDDGSTDDSEYIIRKWQNKFPKNIEYIKKENGGPSSARNLGLKHVKTPWVTFIDADDKVNEIYFEEVDKFLSNTNSIDIVSCNQIFYIEDTQEFKNHYLSYRFKNKETIVNPHNMQGFIQASVNSVFFNHNLLVKYDMFFDERIEPVFEDGYFINNLLTEVDNVNIAFLNQSKYYYRKRSDNSSVINQAWQKENRYLNAIEFGLLKLFKKSKNKYGSVPIYLQRFVLYQLQFYFKRIISAEDQLEFLNKRQLEHFKYLLNELFLDIDSETIEVCALGGLTHKFRLGFYNLYKNKKIYKQVCYIDDYDEIKQELKIHYYYHTQDEERFMLNNIEVMPFRTKILKYEFIGEIFFYEKILYLKCENIWGYFSANIGNIETQVSFKSKRYKNGIQINRVINSLKGKI